MKYIIIYKNQQAVQTDSFNEKDFDSKTMFCVIDKYAYQLTFDGKDYKNIEDLEKININVC